MRNQRRWTGVGLTCAVVAAGLSAFTAAPAMGADSNIVLRTGVLEVHASSAFPRSCSTPTARAARSCAATTSLSRASRSTAQRTP